MRLNNIIIFIIKTVIVITETFLGARFFLKILGASSRAPFVRWVYDTSSTLLNPFEGTFPSLVLADRFIIETSTVFAMIMYALLGFFLLKFFDFMYRQIFEGLQESTADSAQEKKMAEKEKQPSRSTK